MSIDNVYSPYGYRSTKSAPIGALGFNGQLFQAELEGYALGNGHRVYNPCLMRFISPDGLSPFNKGGINGYAYCLNDPVNGRDPSGKNGIFRNITRKIFGFVEQAASHYKALAWEERLTNNQYRNMGEEMNYAIKQVKQSTTLFREITTKNAFAQLEPGWNHKFVLTKESRLVVFSSKDDLTMPSHGSLAEFSGLGFGTKGLGESVKSAGYIILGDGGQISFNNHSGHFQPRFENLYELNDVLEKLGVDANFIRAFGS
ncbi:RHS repeat-associated core domain-containing protein [Pseudomonas monteilii]|uniref:RHS repeat-associated core domain-containing protein n=1 Tax=Pseudomonas monteilii TaxID=76759 RepID=A0AAP7FPC3_9PSED|nr:MULTISPECIES: RHS repeat-associated core domain-containing protein [Pseudomonas]AYN17171.1 RHS repeat-associated core domain-containing protein [Pseudomonas monteilii]AYN99209.1 RHS repeat-associated core domain-containing protein [Pseudomonas sp. LTGT-11-2Z]MBA6103014.1 RHS repeat-associated core domain-containing protein [Pseudomonas monteilii]MCE0874521.1 RHS repeat-associated core domain-containing protein [Pseudomonas monteilii]MCE0927961.1 RHS repeat-associated core domain-containing 